MGMTVRREPLAQVKGQQTRGVADADEFVSAHYRRLQGPAPAWFLSYGEASLQ
jgi:hypothetical protein